MTDDLVQIVLEAMPARAIYRLEGDRLVAEIPPHSTLRAEAFHILQAITMAGYDISKLKK